MKYNLLLITIVIYSVVSLISSVKGESGVDKSPECQEKALQAETCLYQIVLMDRESFPRTDDDVEDYCSKGNSSIKCLSNYKNCLKGLTRQIYSMVRTNVKTVVSDICTNEDKRKGKIFLYLFITIITFCYSFIYTEILIHSKCLNSDTMPEVYRMVQVYSRFLEYIAYNTTLEQMVPRLCCTFQYAKGFMYQTVGSLCDTVSGTETKEYISSLISKIASEVVEIGCGQFGTIEICKAKETDFINTLENISLTTENVTTEVSEALQGKRKGYFLAPVIKIAEDLVL